MKNNLSIFNNLRPITVGFDDMFDHFEHMMDDSFFRGSVQNFPPYNIVKTGENTYDVELALAGFNKKDIEVEYKENLLTVKSKKQNDAEETDEDGNVIHRGISKRMFSKTFTKNHPQSREKKPKNVPRCYGNYADKGMITS